MKLRNLIYSVVIGSLSLGGVYAATEEANASTSEATVAAPAPSASAASSTAGASASAKSKSKKKSSRKKSSRKRSTSRKKSSRKKSSRKRTTSKRRSASSAPAAEQPSNDSLTLAINRAILDAIPQNQNPGGLRVNSVKPDQRTNHTRISLNENFTYLPITQELITHLSEVAQEAMPDSLKDLRIGLYHGQRPLSYYITKVDKLPEQFRKNPPFVVERHPLITPKHGMEGDIVAMWHSHGRYFRSGAWQWQRPALFETLEDIFTMGYILPFAVPMLENAGAYVMLPRERDTNKNEVIVDNDTNDGGELYSQPYYKEKTGSREWTTGEFDGFIYDLRDFRDTENPFEVGTYRQTLSVRTGAPSVAAWYADIPDDGEYAVYISYKSLPNSTEDARYTVNYSGGSKEFRVNQTMGGSTWIYLGTFPLKKGYSATEPIVTLTNLSDKAEGKTVTADAVKIGGGMGNIARSSRRSDVWYDPSTPVNDLASQNLQQTEEEEGDDEEDDDDDSDDDSGDDEGDDSGDDEGDDSGDESDNDIDQSDSANAQPQQEPAKKGAAPTFRTSGLPRFLEGARYWLHWAGIPESIYSPYHGTDDYKDDYTSRGHWVNYLAGGSRVLPNRTGLNIPVDAVMALHSDAGKRSDDSFVGTLGIYYSNNGDSYADGTPRINSRMLTDLLMRQITGDIRQTFEPRWTRRSMWDKSYVEARVPEVPTALIELLSHQNYADMVYGLDPSFRFTVGRSIYKAMARFLAERKDRDLVIQPLPVNTFAITRHGKGKFRLSWQPTPDKLEPTAMPDRYIILERRQGELGFHKIGETHATHFDVKVSDTKIHSFKVIAANEGGLAFDSEILSLREGNDGATPVLIVNGFDRVAGPAHFSEGGNAGFKSEEDFGVPYLRDISFGGHQYEFRRGSGDAFGRSNMNYPGTVIAGNTFDFPAVHGASIANAGYGFTSSSAAAVEKGIVKLSDYKLVDLILGKQKATVVGNGQSGVKFTAFPPHLQDMLKAYADKGGDILISGQYIADELYGPRASEDDRAFAREFLGIEPDSVATRSRSGKFMTLAGADQGIDAANYSYSNTLNEKQYIVEQPNAIRTSGNADSRPFLEMTDNNATVGVLTKSRGSHRAVMTVPFESISDAASRDRLMSRLLKTLMK